MSSFQNYRFRVLRRQLSSLFFDLDAILLVGTILLVGWRIENDRFVQQA